MTVDARTRLRQLGQLDLGAWVEIATGDELWSVQQRIAEAISKPHSRVCVPSCNSSGKTWLAGRIALAFYDAFTPGTPCESCGGPCGGAKIITTSSKFEHLKDNLWGEIRLAYMAAKRRGMEPAGRLYEGDNLRLESAPKHFITGHNPRSAEGMQGYHAPHKLILGDEATALDEQISQGVTGLLASGDARLLLIFNPTTPDTWAAAETRAPRTEVIKITAWDTPHFTGEHAPAGASLVTPDFLAELSEKGMGEGTYEWTTRVCADFWDLSDDTLIPEIWYDRSTNQQGVEGTRSLGVDMATYGSAENVIAFRSGNHIERIQVYPAMRMDTFWRGPVMQAALEFDPDYVIYDGDGVGAGVSGEADGILRVMRPGTQALAFRGALKTSDRFHNARAAWYWALRRRFESDAIRIGFRDDKLRAQLTQIHYSVTAAGDIRIETKEEMRKRGFESPDRADAVMYACALQDSLPLPVSPANASQVKFFGVADHSEEAMWRRSRDPKLKEPRWREVNAVTGIPDDW